MDKRALRKQLRKDLISVNCEDWQQVSQKVTRVLIEWLKKHPEVRTVSIFSALKDEIDLKNLLVFLPDIEWCFPLVNGQEMSFHRVNRIETLVEGYQGIKEPNPQVHPPIISDSIQLIVCPGLAFTKTGKRLGRGGGFYDRFLSESRASYKIGVCLAKQLVEQIPTEHHDIEMTHILTEEGINKSLTSDEEIY